MTLCEMLELNFWMIVLILDGSAENTGLGSNFDLVTMASSFHWAKHLTQLMSLIAFCA